MSESYKIVVFSNTPPEIPEDRPRQRIGCDKCLGVCTGVSEKVFASTNPKTEDKDIEHHVIGVAVLSLTGELLEEWFPGYEEQKPSHHTVAEKMKERGAQCLQKENHAVSKVRIYNGSTVIYTNK
jgi:hypothetical protein